MEGTVFLGSCALGSLVGIPGLVMYSGGTLKRLWGDLVVFLVTVAGLLAITVAFQAIRPEFGMFVAIISTAVCLSLAAMLENLGVRFRSRVISALIVLGLVITPLELLIFWRNGTWFYQTFGALDYGGAAAIGVGAGVAVIAILFRNRRMQTASNSKRTDSSFSTFVGALLFCAAVLVLCIGFELQWDELSPTIIANQVSMALSSGLAASAIERIAKARNTILGVSRGMVAGSIAALASCAYLEFVPGVLVGLLTGAITEYCSRNDRQTLGLPLAIGGVTGLLLLGLFATQTGFVYSGQLTLFVTQAIFVLLAITVGLIVGIIVWLLLKRFSLPELRTK
ncbi:MAG: hypothetical protein KF867_01230 [Cryobacterium sp.]|nr:hypothetical protein [Cryobacterium sp.]MBX3103577.1 hypothetical protein [Cryobacterium sp.]